MIFKKHIIKIVFLLGFSLSLASVTFAQGTKIPNPGNSYVNDFAKLLSSNDQNNIAKLCTELDKKTSAQVAVVTIDSTKPYSIQNYSVQLFDKWKIGKQGKDNGVLILIAASDRKAWITTGYGLEGAIPDLIANKIVTNIMVPYFKNNQYSQGIKKGAIAVISLIGKEYNVTITGQESQVYSRVHRKKSFLELLFTFVFILILLSSRSGLLGFFLLGSLSGGRRRNGYWHGSGLGGSSGGFGGGFGGFGGGMTGGGGGGGGW